MKFSGPPRDNHMSASSLMIGKHSVQKTRKKMQIDEHAVSESVTKRTLQSFTFIESFFRANTFAMSSA